MTNIEALELLKQGDKVMMKDDRTGQFYQSYSDEHIYQMIPAGTCCSRVISCYTPEQFLQTGNIDFIVVD